ncbi:MAG TPA: hypothetical protein VFI65_30285 [Streptosporangiaceae bacterium]|nr:hypothetical protein [Streptosporangiaceae bacterium]
MRKLFAVFAVLLTVVLTANSALAAPLAKANTFTSCRAQGDFATCITSGNTLRPVMITVHVSATPRQGVAVDWNLVCSKGTGAGGKSGKFHGRAPISRVIRHPYVHPDNCTVAAGGNVNRSGHIHVWITATHWQLH